MSKPNEPPPPAYPGNYPQAGATTFPSQPPPPSAGGYYPGQPQVYPPGPGHPQVYPQGPGYVGVTVVRPIAMFRQHPVPTVCQFCQASIVTQVTMDTGLLPWLLCGGIFLLGGVAGCCLIPFCINDLKDAIHMCPQCRQVVGSYKRM